MSARKGPPAESYMVSAWRSRLSVMKTVDAYLVGTQLVTHAVVRKHRQHVLPAEAVWIGRYRHPCPTDVFRADLRAVLAERAP